MRCSKTCLCLCLLLAGTGAPQAQAEDHYHRQIRVKNGDRPELVIHLEYLAMFEAGD
jgi:hypothetical protein